MKVLLVDDEVELVSAMAERLSMRGIDAEWATNADSALRQLDINQYDVAVLDVKMPGIDGIALKKRMEEKNPKMKFIFLTGHGSEADFRSGSKEAGPEYYLIKPIDLEELIDKMARIFEAKGGET